MNFGLLLQYVFLEYVKRYLASFSPKIKTLLTCYFKSKNIEISGFSQTSQCTYFELLTKMWSDFRYKCNYASFVRARM